MIKGFIDGLPLHKKQRQHEYDMLTKTPYLYSSDFLKEMYENSRKKEEHECILGHMYNHNTKGIEGYDKLEREIIDRYWK